MVKTHVQANILWIIHNLLSKVYAKIESRTPNCMVLNAFGEEFIFENDSSKLRDIAKSNRKKLVKLF